MMTSILAASTPFIFARGDTWQLPALYQAPGVNGAAPTPVDLTGSVVTGELYLARRPVPILLTVANGGLAVDATAGAMTFELAPALSQYATPDPYPPGAVPPTYTYPNRLQVIIQDTLGDVLTQGILPILVYDGRSVPIGSVPQNANAILPALGQQGPPGVAGPSVSVNGHTGAVQTLTAADVGAATPAQAAAAAAALALILG